VVPIAMTSTDFNKLYKELCRTDINRKVHDIDFEREREELFFSLGHNVQRAHTEKIQRSKHHGKNVRRAVAEHQFNDIKEKHVNELRFKEELVKKKSLQTQREKADRLTAITSEMHEYMERGEQIPDSLIKKLDRLSRTEDKLKFLQEREGGAVVKTTSRRQQQQQQQQEESGQPRLLKRAGTGRMTLPPLSGLAHGLMVSKDSDSVSINHYNTVKNMNPPLRYANSTTLVAPVFIDLRAGSKPNCAYTTCKWTLEERDKISYLYHDMEAPSNRYYLSPRLSATFLVLTT
jgi:hypothetical protein